MKWACSLMSGGFRKWYNSFRKQAEKIYSRVLKMLTYCKYSHPIFGTLTLPNNHKHRKMYIDIKWRIIYPNKKLTTQCLSNNRRVAKYSRLIPLITMQALKHTLWRYTKCQGKNPHQVKRTTVAFLVKPGRLNLGVHYYPLSKSHFNNN